MSGSKTQADRSRLRELLKNYEKSAREAFEEDKLSKEMSSLIQRKVDSICEDIAKRIEKGWHENPYADSGDYSYIGSFDIVSIVHPADNKVIQFRKEDREQIVAELRLVLNPMNVAVPVTDNSFSTIKVKLFSTVF